MSLMDGAPAAGSSRLLFTIAETEALLSLSHASIYRLIRAGRLDARKVGSATRITSGSIERLIAELPTVGRSA